MNHKKSGALYLPKYRLCPHQEYACLRPALMDECLKEKKLKRLGIRSNYENYKERRLVVSKCKYRGEVKMKPDIYNLFRVINEIYKGNALPEICNKCRKVCKGSLK